MQISKVATVGAANTSIVCPGIAYASDTCSACANLGTGAVLAGATAATCVSAGQSPCCNFPYFYLGFAGTTVKQYAFLELTALPSVRARAAVPDRDQVLTFCQGQRPS